MSHSELIGPLLGSSYLRPILVATHAHATALALSELSASVISELSSVRRCAVLSWNEQLQDAKKEIA
jgi:hypothetical protein